jgi:hypothetical protein
MEMGRDGKGRVYDEIGGKAITCWKRGMNILSGFD